MLSRGDAVVYKCRGMYKVEEIGTLDFSFADSKKKYYTLQSIEDAKDKAYVPTDDEKNIREGLGASFEMEGYEVRLAADGQEGLDFLSKGDIDLVITDLRMDGISGEEVLRRVTTEMPGIPVIVLTGHGSIDAAVDAIDFPSGFCRRDIGWRAI